MIEPAYAYVHWLIDTLWTGSKRYKMKLRWHQKAALYVFGR